MGADKWLLQNILFCAEKGIKHIENKYNAYF